MATTLDAATSLERLGVRTPTFRPAVVQGDPTIISTGAVWMQRSLQHLLTSAEPPPPAEAPTGGAETALLRVAAAGAMPAYERDAGGAHE